MKRFLCLFLVVCCFSKISLLNAQAKAGDTATYLLRIYDDNDGINFHGKPTDDAYTNGTSAELFYTRKKPPRFIDKLLLKAGQQSVNVYSYGVTQVMFTPKILSATYFQQDDYPYAGALFTNHSLASYNPSKKILLKTSLIAGVQGPASGDKDAQRFLHRILGYQQPMGWDYQSKNKLLLNFGFTAEKELAHSGKNLSLIGGTDIYWGSFYKQVSFRPQLRIGKMAPYFNGCISQFSDYKQKGKRQLYLVLQPQISYVFYNSLLETPTPAAEYNNNNGLPYWVKQLLQYNPLQNVQYSFTCMGVATFGHFGISASQSWNNAMLKGLYNHQVGNISLYFSWK